MFLFFILTATMAPVTLTKTFGLRGIQYMWSPNDNYGWMSDTLGGKFNFYYQVGDMVTDGILDAGRTKIQDDIMVKLRTWYVKQIHDKVTDAGITNSTIVRWKAIIDNVDMQSLAFRFRQYIKQGIIFISVLYLFISPWTNPF